MASENAKKNVAVFDQDVVSNDGYLYTHSERLSTRLSNKRMTQGIASATHFKNKTVLDLGCGDGTFSFELASLGARSVLGIDPAVKAIELGRVKAATLGYAEVSFQAANLYELTLQENAFDVVVLRGVLHHLPDPALAIKLAVSWGKEVVILEPNGMNLALKLIEKLSAYHREHEEQSFLLATMRSWVNVAGGKIAHYEFINTVPIFCHSWLASVLKSVEPLVEKIPLLRAMLCGQYVLRVVK